MNAWPAPISMPPSSKAGTIKQEVVIRGATPREVYETLLDAKKHAALTGGEALISRHVGGSFTTFDGWASGQQLEFVADTKIVQTWRADEWPAGAESVCTYVFSAVPTGTKITFTQTGVPKEFVKNVGQGWREYYWEPLQKLFSTG